MLHICVGITIVQIKMHFIVKNFFHYEFCLCFSSSALFSPNGKWLINTNFRKVIGTAIEIRSFGGSNPVNKETVMLILQIDVTKTLLSIFINSYTLLFLFKAYIPLRDQVSQPTQTLMSRSNPPEVFLGKGVLKICSKFTGEQPC